MKKVLVALVIVMGLGFSVAKADEPLKKKSRKWNKEIRGKTLHLLRLIIFLKR